MEARAATTARAVDTAMLQLLATATVLFDCTDRRGCTARGPAAAALLLALACMAAAQLMDWFVFGPARSTRPDFFLTVAVAALIPPLLMLGARRLRDAGHGGRMMLLALVPVAGWLLLAWLWCRPTVRTSGRARDRV